MKKNVLVAVIVVTALAVLTTGVALAQEPTPPTPGGWDMGQGMMGRFGYAADRFGPIHEYMEQAMSDALGISVDEFEAQREAGKTAYEIALGLGFTADEIPALLSEARANALQAAAAAGVITQEQLEWMNARHARLGFGMGNCDGTPQGRGGMMGRWGLQQSNPQ